MVTLELGGEDEPQSVRPPRKRQWRWRVFYVFLAITLLYILLSGLIATLSKKTPKYKLIENEEWVSSSRFWLDRQLCRWIGCCGTFHMLNHAGWTWAHEEPHLPSRDFSSFWHAGQEDPDNWSSEERARRTIPQYVLDHAPYIHLSSNEQYWPSDIAEHLVHVTPWLNHTPIAGLNWTRDLLNLDELNSVENGSTGRDVYLHSDENIEDFPVWLRSEYNIPPHTTAQCHVHETTTSLDGRCGGPCNVTCSGSGYGSCCSIYGFCGNDEDHCNANCSPLFGRCRGPSMTGRYGPKVDLKKRDTYSGGKSGAPVILIVIPKENGIIDAFWFFFYSYNLGKQVLNIRFGNHVGDWEHTMVRFKHGVPIEIYLSEHSWGESFAFDALEKYAPDAGREGIMLSSWRNASSTRAHFKRPVVYSAEGSHAMYATPDYHSYVAPFGILHDDTDRGPLLDPVKNFKAFTYDVKSDHLRSSTLNPDAPTQWFDFTGHWGDRYYLLSDPRQYRFAGEYHYQSGPLGPKFKNLAREHSCLVPGECKVRESIRDEDGIRAMHQLHDNDQPENTD